MSKVYKSIQDVVKAENELLQGRLESMGHSIAEVISGEIKINEECSQGNSIKLKKLVLITRDSPKGVHLISYFIVNHNNGNFSIRIL